jgi:hypothetical protein
VGIFEHILNTPYAYIWLPGLVFGLIVGGVFWFSRPWARINAKATATEEDALQAATTTVTPRDQRVAFRRQGNPVEVYITTSAERKHPAIGSVLDRSVGGVRLALFDPVEVGAVLSIRPKHADDIVPWIEVEIRSCRPSTEMPDRFDVGCQYVKSPPYSIQLLFG